MGKPWMGTDIQEVIYQLAKEEEIQTGVIFSGIVALEKVVFRNLRTIPADFKIEDRNRLYLNLQQLMEFISPQWMDWDERGWRA